MITLNEFEKFYHGVFQKQIQPIRAARKKLLLKMFLYIFSIIVIIISMYAFAIFVVEPNQREFDNSTFIAVLMTLGLFAHVVAGSLLIFLLIGMKSKFIERFKNEIIKEIVTFLDPNLSYYPNKYISLSEFSSSRLFKWEAEKYSGDDYISGKIGTTEIRFSEIHAFYRVKKSNGDKDNFEKLFGGMFIIADFNKNFRGRTYVLPDLWERKIGKLAQFFQSADKHYGQLVKLEDPEFEKVFKVYSSDQIEGRYILSTSLMKRILDFRNKTGIEVLMSFSNSNLFIALPMKRKLFEPKIFGAIVSLDTMREYLTDLMLAVGVVEDLNLNVRIWTKN